MNFIKELENALGIQAIKEFLPMQPGDVASTASNTESLENWVGFKPNTSIEEGISKFVSWYKDFYKF